MNIVIPCAGAGRRYKEAGYDIPKPLIPVNGIPMLARAAYSIGLHGRYIFPTQTSYLNDWRIHDKIKEWFGLIHQTFVSVNGFTEGAACTVLEAEVFINTNEPLFIADSDMILEWNALNFLKFLKDNDPDGVLLTYTSTDPKNSFVGTDVIGSRVMEVAEKQPISNIANCGGYYFKYGSDFVWAAREMMRANKRVNNEFYVAPVYNELVRTHFIMHYPTKHWSLSTPKDLEIYLAANPRT